jgi:hypothetical protein
MKGFNDTADEVGNNTEKIVGDTASAIATPVSNEKDFAGLRIIDPLRRVKPTGRGTSVRRRP